MKSYTYVSVQLLHAIPPENENNNSSHYPGQTGWGLVKPSHWIYKIQTCVSASLVPCLQIQLLAASTYWCSPASLVSRLDGTASKETWLDQPAEHRTALCPQVLSCIVAFKGSFYTTIQRSSTLWIKRQRNLLIVHLLPCLSAGNCLLVMVTVSETLRFVSHCRQWVKQSTNILGKQIRIRLNLPSVQ